MSRPPHRGLRHVALNVRALQRMKHFYVDVLGYRIEWEPDADNVYLTSGSDNLALHRAAEAAPVDDAVAGGHMDGPPASGGHMGPPLRGPEDGRSGHVGADPRVGPDAAEHTGPPQRQVGADPRVGPDETDLGVGPGALDHLGLLVAKAEDVDAWAIYLESRGVTLDARPRTHRDGARSLYFKDPDGNRIQIIHHPPLVDHGDR